MDGIIRTFEHVAQRLPLELFVLLGSFTEEIVSPIPSFIVLIPAGAAAQVQGFSWWYLPVLAVLSACGRIVASVILYTVADRGEDWLFGRGRRFFGVSHAQLERYGRRLSATDNGWISLFLLNAIPVLPTSLLSLACGFIKLRLRLFVTATFFGTAINAVIYLSIGYGGIQAAAVLGKLQTVFQVTTIAVVALFLGWLLYIRRKRRRG